MTLHGVGVDIVDVHRISRLIEARGESFTGRWFTPEETAQCVRAAVPARAFAGRFAAKEAVWKALAPDDWKGPVPWRSVGVVARVGAAGFVVHLSDALADTAARLGVTSIRVSIAVHHDVATAVALAGRDVSDARPR